MREEIKAKADKLGQFYFPDDCNMWARANVEAQSVSSACTEMAEWMQKKMIDKACEWLMHNVNRYINDEGAGYFRIEKILLDHFRKAMED